MCPFNFRCSCFTATKLKSLNPFPPLNWWEEDMWSGNFSLRFEPDRKWGQKNQCSIVLKMYFELKPKNAALSILHFWILFTSLLLLSYTFVRLEWAFLSSLPFWNKTLTINFGYQAVEAKNNSEYEYHCYVFN